MYPLIVFDVKNTEIVLNGLIISHILYNKKSLTQISKSPVVCYLHNLLTLNKVLKLTDNAIFYFFVFWCGRPFFPPYGEGKSYYEVSYQLLIYVDLESLCECMQTSHKKKYLSPMICIIFKNYFKPKIHREHLFINIQLLVYSMPLILD